MCPNATSVARGRRQCAHWLLVAFEQGSALTLGNERLHAPHRPLLGLGEPEICVVCTCHRRQHRRHAPADRARNQRITQHRHLLQPARQPPRLVNPASRPLTTLEPRRRSSLIPTHASWCVPPRRPALKVVIRRAVAGDLPRIVALFTQVADMHREAMPWLFREVDERRTREMHERFIVGSGCATFRRD